MLLAIDAGNTTITFALYDDRTLAATGGWDRSRRTEDEYAAILHTLFSENELVSQRSTAWGYAA